MTILQTRAVAHKLSSFAPSATPPRYLPDRTFKTRHISLEITVDVEKRTLHGTCTLFLQILAHHPQHLEFDAVALDISRVMLRVGSASAKPKAVPFAVAEGKVKVTVSSAGPLVAGADCVVEITYAMQQSRAGVHFLGPDITYPARPLLCWTQGESDDARCWFPCFDHPSEKATLEMAITTDNRFQAIANGELVASRRGRRTTRWHWRFERPTAMYLFAFAVGEFEEYRPAKTVVPLVYYAPVGRMSEAKRGFRKTDAAMRFMQRETGVPYPFGHYAQAALYEFGGGMENSSITFQTDQVLLDAKAALDIDMDALVSHELAHQWFGDSVTCREWSHGWLNESFASYYEARFFYDDQGADEFFRRMWQHREGYLAEDYRRPIVTRKWRESFQLFDRHLYQKGACLLHDLRHRLGEELWGNCIRAYLLRFRDSSADTADFVRVVQEHSGYNLEPLFEQWLLRAGHPELHVTHNWDNRRKTLQLHVTQTQAVSDAQQAFALPLPVVFVFADGSRSRAQIDLSGVEQVFSCVLPQQPRNIILDPDWQFFLKQVTQHKPASMWDVQLHDPHLLNRREAVFAIAARNTAAAVKLLQQALSRESFWWLKAEILVALGSIHLPQTIDILRAHCSDQHPKVRRAAVAALQQRRRQDLAELFNDLFRRDPSVMVRSEALKALAASGHDSALAVAEQGLKQPSWSEVIGSAAVWALAELQGYQALSPRFLRPGTNAYHKAAALREMAKRSQGDPKVTQILLNALDDPSELVPYIAAHYLAEHGDCNAVPQLRERFRKTHDSILRAAIDQTILALRHGNSDEPPKPTAITPEAQSTSGGASKGTS